MELRYIANGFVMSVPIEMAGGVQHVPNPDEMETQILVDLTGPMVPCCAPAACLEAVMTGRLVGPVPCIDPTMQYKQAFKSLVDGETRHKPKGTLVALNHTGLD